MLSLNLTFDRQICFFCNLFEDMVRVRVNVFVRVRFPITVPIMVRVKVWFEI